MQVNKRDREKEKLEKELRQIKSNIAKRGLCFQKFCAENGILRQSAEKLYRGEWKGKKSNL